MAGAFKGHGYATDLLNACIEDAEKKGKNGLCILSAAKKKPFLADPKFLKYKGFMVCDESDIGIQLWYLPFREEAPTPEFKECALHPHIDEPEYVLFIPINVRLMQNMFLYLKKLPRKEQYHLKLYIYRIKKMREMHRHRLQHMHYFLMETTLRMSR